MLNPGLWLSLFQAGGRMLKAGCDCFLSLSGGGLQPCVFPVTNARPKKSCTSQALLHELLYFRQRLSISNVRWQRTLRLFHLLMLLLLIKLNHTHFVTTFLLTTQGLCFANGHSKETLLEILLLNEWPKVMADVAEKEFYYHSTYSHKGTG